MSCTLYKDSYTDMLVLSPYYIWEVVAGREVRDCLTVQTSSEFVSWQNLNWSLWFDTPWHLFIIARGPPPWPDSYSEWPTFIVSICIVLASVQNSSHPLSSCDLYNCPIR